MVTTEQKELIAKNVKAYVNHYGSQNRAAETLKNVSAATVSQILNDKWEKISDEMWRNIESQIFTTTGWQAVETKFYKTFSKILTDSKEYSIAYAVCGDAGSGKTFTAKQFVTNNQNAYHIVCNDNWKVRAFYREILRAIGRESAVRSTENEPMFDEIVRTLKKQDRPLLIFDEADKLCDQVLYQFITLYNELEDFCGIVICATNYLETKINNGITREKRGYNEIYSRIGRRFVKIPKNTSVDITNICKANGIEDADVIDHIIGDSDCDLRRVRRKIHANDIQ